MTIYEQRLFEIMINTVPKIEKHLESISKSLEQISKSLEAKNEQTDN